MLALKRIPWRLRREKAREWARKSHAPSGTRESARMARGEPLDAAIWRAKQDRRGQVIRHGVTYSSVHLNGQPWTVIHSKLGRTSQVDLHIGGSLAFTGSLRTLTRAMKRYKL